MTGLKARLADWLERSTTASRRRNAAGMFMFGESSPADRAVAPDDTWLLTSLKRAREQESSQ